MAKKKDPLATALTQMQSMSNKAQKEIQKMINDANSAQSAFNAEEARKSREWQETMSRSAHQMEVEDLKKAGLNPVLSSGGSGAQSYTTSSASMTPDSGAAALSSLAGSQLSAMGNIESSRIGAEATKAAAAASAQAMKAAAQTSAYAQMYGADKSYEKAVKVAKITTKAQKWISQNKQASSWSALFDKWTHKAGIAGPALSGIRKFVSAGNSKCEALIKNASKYFSNKGAITAKNFKLNDAGISYVNKILKSQGLKPTASNRNAYIKAFVYKDQNAFNAYSSVLYSTHYKHGNKSGSARKGHK